MKSYNFYKWRIWWLLAFSFVMALFHRSALGAISTDISNTLELTALELSNMASITFYTYALMQVPSGILIDTYGYKKMSILGMFVTGLGSIVFGLAPHVAMSYIGRFLIGFGTSFIFISALKAQKTWFTKEDFTKASGMLSFIGNIGGIFSTFPLAFLAGVTGWRSSMIIMGFVCMVIATLIYFLTANSPTDYGFEAILDETSDDPVDETVPKQSLYQRFHQTCLSKHTIRNFFVMFTLVSGTTTLTGLWGIRYLETVYRMTSTEASFYTAFIIYGHIVGALCINSIAKRFGEKFYMYPRIAAITTSVLWGYILFVCGGKPSLGVLLVIFFIMGFVAMAHILAFVDINDKMTKHNSGLASSIVNSGEFLGGSIISLVIGALLDFTWTGAIVGNVRYYTLSSYRSAFMIFFVLSLLGIVTSFIGTKQSAHT